MPLLEVTVGPVRPRLLVPNITFPVSQLAGCFPQTHLVWWCYALPANQNFSGQHWMAPGFHYNEASMLSHNTVHLQPTKCTCFHRCCSTSHSAFKQAHCFFSRPVRENCLLENFNTADRTHFHTTVHPLMRDLMKLHSALKFLPLGI